MTVRWYVVQVKPCMEKTAIANLKELKVKTFCPLYEHVKKIKGKMVSELLPLFPSYIFVRFDINRNKKWRKIKYTKGVEKIIGCTEFFIPPLPKGFVEQLQNSTGKNGVVELAKAVEQIITYQPGDKVQLKDPRYNGLVGTYCKGTNERITVLLTLLARPVVVQLKKDAVVPYTQPPPGGVR